jgi:hypothetical protein
MHHGHVAYSHSTVAHVRAVGGDDDADQALELPRRVLLRACARFCYDVLVS